MIAKAIAKDAGCRFINLQGSSLKDKWYGESEKLASAVFTLVSVPRLVTLIRSILSLYLFLF